MFYKHFYSLSTSEQYVILSNSWRPRTKKTNLGSFVGVECMYIPAADVRISRDIIIIIIIMS